MTRQNGPNVTNRLTGVRRLPLGLTHEVDYAIRAMLALAAHDAADPLSSRRIAAGWGIPQRFLVRVLGRLVEAGLVSGVPGRKGGYRIARPSTRITLLDVILALDPQPFGRRCVLRGGPCLPDGSCLVHEAFTVARDGYLAELGSRSLADILAVGGWSPAPRRAKASMPGPVGRALEAEEPRPA